MYLETSVISAYFDFWKTDFKQKRLTRWFWQYILPDYYSCVSEIVLAEIHLNKNPIWREKLLRLVRDFSVIRTDQKIQSIAKRYIKAKIFPQSEYRDALHVASAAGTCSDYLVSWNQKHIIRPFKRKQITEFNQRVGLGNPTILSPLDFLETIP